MSGSGRPLGRAALVGVAVAVVLVAGSAAWWRAGREPAVSAGPSPSSSSSPVSGTELAPLTEADRTARIYPVLREAGLANLAGHLGMEPVVTTGPVVPPPGPALVLARRDGDRLGDLITITVVPEDAEFLDLAGASRSVGGREVTLPFGEAGPDLAVTIAATASEADVDVVGRALDDSPVVSSAEYLDRDASWAAFQAENPDLSQAELAQMDRTMVPTSFRVDLADDDPAVVAGLAAQLQGLSGVLLAQPGSDHLRYLWTEAGAAIVVDYGRGAADVIDAVIAALTVTPRDGSLPAVAVDPRPDGLVEMVAVESGPAGSGRPAVPMLVLEANLASFSVSTSRQPDLRAGQSYTMVRVGDREGFLASDSTGTDPGSSIGSTTSLMWPLDDGWWAVLYARDVDGELAPILAADLEFVDAPTWEGRYGSLLTTTTRPDGPAATTAPSPLPLVTTAPPTTGPAPTAGSTTTGP